MKKEITQEDALTFYSHLDEAGKQLFKDLYKEFFAEVGYEAACKKLGLNPQDELPYPDPKTKRQRKSKCIYSIGYSKRSHWKSSRNR